MCLIMLVTNMKLVQDDKALHVANGGTAPDSSAPADATGFPHTIAGFKTGI
jgi:hypothetical protein